MVVINRQWRANGRPAGRALRDGDFAYHEEPARTPQAGEVLVRSLYLSMDPSLKGWMGAFGAAAEGQGPVIFGLGVGQVLQSESSRLTRGDMVVGPLGWQDHPTLEASELEKVPNDELLSANLGVLGLTGLTALFGLRKIGRPFPGDTVVVTGAAGATGSIAGQLAKLSGCHVVGIAGGVEKCRWLTDELGFDAAIDYKSSDLRSELERLAVSGIDVLWDNVGGEQLDTLLGLLNLNARVVLCGGIARYTQTPPPPGPTNYFSLVTKRSQMEGFLIGDYASEFPWGRERLRDLLRRGLIKHREDVKRSFENAPKALDELFSGANFGKRLLHIADPI